MPRRASIHAVGGKNPAAVALGLLGASKGGRARAKRLSAARRRAIAQRAARARWKGHKKAERKSKGAS